MVLNLKTKLFTLAIAFCGSTPTLASSAPAVKGAALEIVSDPRNSEVAEVLGLYSKTERFTAEVPTSGADPKNIFVDFVQAGKYEANAPTPSNLLVVKESPKSAPQLFIFGPLLVSSVTKISGNKYVVKGPSDPDVTCANRGSLQERTMTIEVVLSKDKDGKSENIIPKYLDISEKEIPCQKPTSP